MSNPSVFPRGIHRLAVFLAGYVVLLITAGGLVKSLEAGLSVPDWPLSYGMLNPPRWWEIETVRAEHGHRLIAGVALILTVVLTVWIARKEERSWVRKLAYLALVAVLAQAALGGITVLFYLPTAISVSHAGLAQAFLVLVVTLAVVTSRFWFSQRQAAAGVDAAGLVALTSATTVLIYLQILVGAVMRHIGAGLAIPDFPLVFGGLMPPKLDSRHRDSLHSPNRGPAGGDPDLLDAGASPAAGCQGARSVPPCSGPGRSGTGSRDPRGIGGLDQ